MPGPPTRPPHRHSVDAVERLYVLWIGSTAMLLVVLILVVFFARGALQRQTRTIDEISQRLVELERTVARPPGGSREGPTTRPTGAAGGPPSARPAPAGSPPPLPAHETSNQNKNSPADRPGATRPTSPATRPSAAAPTDAAIANEIQSVLHQDATGYVLGDKATAAALLKHANECVDQAAWRGERWARLAIIARLLSDDASAETFLDQAEAAGDPALVYYEFAVAALLRAGRSDQATALARRCVENTPTAAAARLLLAETFAAQDNAAGIAEALLGATPSADWSMRERLRLGRVLIAGERWAELANLVKSLANVPERDAPERDFLRAVLLVREGQLAEALAVLDYLAEQRPEDFDTRLWRGVALLDAKQFEAARQALSAAAELAPLRPAGWYWRGVLEVTAGQAEAAVGHFQNALAASARYAPAWEALGALDVNRGDASGALEFLSKATEADPKRATSWFLTALANAKLSRRDAAANALAIAMKLDASLLETAQRTEVLLRLFDAEELKALLSAATSQPQAG